MQALEELWHYCYTCRFIWIASRGRFYAMAASQISVFVKLRLLATAAAAATAVVCAKRSNGCLKLATSSPRFQVQFENKIEQPTFFARLFQPASTSRPIQSD
jgi:hypothetical protein